MNRNFTLIGAALLGLTSVSCQNLEEQKLAALTKLGTAAVRLAVDVATMTPPPAEKPVPAPQRARVVAVSRSERDALRAQVVRFEYRIEVCAKRTS